MERSKIKKVFGSVYAKFSPRILSELLIIRLVTTRWLFSRTPYSKENEKKYIKEVMCLERMIEEQEAEIKKLNRLKINPWQNIEKSL